MGKNMSKKVSGKYSQKPVDHAKQSITDALEKCFKKSDSKDHRIFIPE